MGRGQLKAGLRMACQLGAPVQPSRPRHLLLPPERLLAPAPEVDEEVDGLEEEEEEEGPEEDFAAEELEPEAEDEPMAPAVASTLPCSSCRDGGGARARGAAQALRKRTACSCWGRTQCKLSWDAPAASSAPTQTPCDCG